MEDVFSDIGHHRKRKPVRYPGNNRLGAKIRVLKRENGWEMGGFEGIAWFFHVWLRKGEESSPIERLLYWNTHGGYADLSSEDIYFYLLFFKITISQFNLFFIPFCPFVLLSSFSPRETEDRGWFARHTSFQRLELPTRLLYVHCITFVNGPKPGPFSFQVFR